MSCEHCPEAGGPCPVCGDQGPRPVNVLRGLIARAEAQLEQLRAELAAALVAEGRRPGDGSDQPGLFDPEAQARLF